MKDLSSTQTRVNLLLPLDISIKIEREVDKRGINRTQYIREAIHDKLQGLSHTDEILREVSEVKKEIEILKSTITELKAILLLSAQK